MKNLNLLSFEHYVAALNHQYPENKDISVWVNENTDMYKTKYGEAYKTRLCADAWIKHIHNS